MVIQNMSEPKFLFVGQNHWILEMHQAKIQFWDRLTLVTVTTCYLPRTVQVFSVTDRKPWCCSPELHWRQRLGSPQYLGIHIMVICEPQQSSCFCGCLFKYCFRLGCLLQLCLHVLELVKARRCKASWDWMSASFATQSVSRASSNRVSINH